MISVAISNRMKRPMKLHHRHRLTLLNAAPFCCSEGDSGDAAVDVEEEDAASEDEGLNGAMMYEAVPDFLAKDDQ